MKVLVYALLTGAAAVALWHPLADRRATPAWLRELYRSGHLFIPIGLLVGLALDLAPGPAAAVRADLWPLVAFAAALVGFRVGSTFDRKAVRAASPRTLLTYLAPSVLAASVTIGGAVLLLLTATSLSPDRALSLALILGAAAACSGAPLIAWLAGNHADDSDGRRTHRRAATAARADDAVVLTLALVAFAAAGFTSTAPAIELFLPLVGGAVLGAVAWLLVGTAAKDDERLLHAIALIAFGAGFGAWIGDSPAVVGAVMAATLVALPGDRVAALRPTIDKLARPAVVLLMAATGITIAPWVAPEMLAVAALLVAVRAGAFAVTGRLLPELGGAASLLSAPGHLGLVVAFTFHHMAADQASAILLGGIALAALADKLRVVGLAARVTRELTPEEASS